MPDVDSTQPEPADNSTDDQQQDAPATGEDQLGDAGKKALDRMKAERDEARRKARENSDAAKRLAEIEDEKKSETEKAADRIAKAEAEVASVPSKVAEALRGHLVAVHKISDEDAELFLTASEPELLLKQIDRLVARNAEASGPRSPRPDPAQGRHTQGVRPDAKPGLGRLREAYAANSK